MEEPFVEEPFDPLAYVEPWTFDPPPTGQAASFRFNAYNALQKIYRPTKGLYSDQPAVKLKLQCLAKRHAQQQQLGANQNLSASQMGDWRGVAAAIYEVTLQSPPVGPLRTWFLKSLLAEQQVVATRTSAARRSQKQRAFLGVTPEQPASEHEKGEQLGIAPASASRYICLFNVVVACEWWPISYFYQRQLLWSFREMSDFLYDVTDGYMALGNVAIGGPDLMDSADIQILASNRLHPRSWVSAMQIDYKYMPIRVGRGLWNKRTRRTLPWDSPEGYRTLVHEWAHHALGLKDSYLERVGVDRQGKKLVAAQDATRPELYLAVPSISLPIESVMSVLVGTSELVDHPEGSDKRAEWDSLRKRFPKLKIPYPYDRDEGPGRLPLPLPEIQIVAYPAPAAIAEQSVLELPNDDPSSTDPSLPEAPVADPQVSEALTVEQRFQPPVYKDPKSLPKAERGIDRNNYPVVLESHCWVYTLRGSLTRPQQLIAHGSLDARAAIELFPLPGAQIGDKIILIGDGYLDAQAPGKNAVPIVLSNILGPPDEDNNFTWQWPQWIPTTAAAFPLVDVYPGTGCPLRPPYHIEVAINAAGWHGWVFPLGLGTPAGALQRLEDQALRGDQRGELYDLQAGLPSLDGHILLTNGEDDLDKAQIVIAAYSIGGGPKSINPPYPAPFPAGSSEGDALIFFYDKHASTPREDDNPNIGQVAITTRNYGIQLDKAAAEAAYEPCSYTFSFAANKPMPREQDATLIMFIDRDTVGEDDQIELRRYNDSTNGIWERIEAFYNRDLSLVAAPLYDKDHAYSLIDPETQQPIETAPGLFLKRPVAERFRLVLKRLARRGNRQ